MALRAYFFGTRRFPGPSPIGNLMGVMIGPSSGPEGVGTVGRDGGSVTLKPTWRGGALLREGAGPFGGQEPVMEGKGNTDGDA